MAVHIGIDYTPGQWRVCVLEEGRPADLRFFSTVDEMLGMLSQICASYPEPTMVVSLAVITPFVALADLSDEQLERLVQRYHPTPAFLEVKTALQALRALSLHSYCAPSVEYLPAVPLHRFLLRSALGSADELCAVVNLLHHMRTQQATWEEMNFLFINTGENGTCILVIVDGRVINGIDTLQGSSLAAAYGSLALAETAEEELTEEERGRRETFQQALDEAFWEGLTQELAGLLALHHIEDLVVLGSRSDRLIDRLADTYQIYLFPRLSSESTGYESALGAALLAEGLD